MINNTRKTPVLVPVDRRHIGRVCNQLGTDNIITTTKSSCQRLLYTISVLVICCYCNSILRQSSTSIHSVSAFHATTITTITTNNNIMNMNNRRKSIQSTQDISTTTETIRLQPQFLLSPMSTKSSSSSTSLNMFMGSDGGLLGIGGPEAATILLVGYFVLGPSDLYKLVKEIGKFFQNIQSLSTDLTKTFESNMNDVVQIDELRKAQRELNDAFSFRRSINVDSDLDAFTVKAGSAQQNEAAMAAASVATSTSVTSTATATSTSKTETTLDVDDGTVVKKRKVRRRIIKRSTEPVPDELLVADNNNIDVDRIPDLDMSTTNFMGPTISTSTSKNDDTDTTMGMTPAELEELDREFEKYTSLDYKNNNFNYNTNDGDFISSTQCYDDDKHNEKDIITTKEEVVSTKSVLVQEIKQETNRFQQQLSGNWNNQILSKQDELEPMALLMNKVALLEKEKSSALQRIQDEYNQREQLEKEYYIEQRKLLEEAITSLQEKAFGIK